MKQLFKLSNRNLMRILLCLISTIICLSDPQVGVTESVEKMEGGNEAIV